MVSAKFNVLAHRLVPEHHLLSDAEAGKVLSDLEITKDQLPKIHVADPVIQILAKIHGPVAEGRIIKIVRSSETAGIHTAYRMVMGR